MASDEDIIEQLDAGISYRRIAKNLCVSHQRIARCAKKLAYLKQPDSFQIRIVGESKPCESSGVNKRVDLFDPEIPIYVEGSNDYIFREEDYKLDPNTPGINRWLPVVETKAQGKPYDWEPLDCGKEPERILHIPDTHSPFHDRRAWDCMIKYAKQWHPHTIVHHGDLADFYSVSDHDKDPRRAHNLADECVTTRALLDELDSLGATRKRITLGNHEYRLDRYLMRHAPALLGAVDTNGLLQLRERGWDVIPYMEHGRVGKLHVTHEAGKSGATAVRQMAQAVGHNIAFGHTHRLECMYFGNVIGDRYISASLGWLGDASSATYMSAIAKASWQLGFGTSLMLKDGNFRLNLMPIVDYRVITF